MRKSILTLVLTVLIGGCNNPPPATSHDVRFRVLDEGQTSGLTQQKFLTFHNEADFASFWNIHSNGNLSNMPKVNFNRKMVIAAFLGERRTGGYAVRIENIVELETMLQVEVLVTKPEPGSERTMMITQPYTVVELPQTKKHIDYTFRMNR